MMSVSHLSKILSIAATLANVFESYLTMPATSLPIPSKSEYQTIHAHGDVQLIVDLKIFLLVARVRQNSSH